MVFEWFFELCEKLKPIIKEAVEEFCKENNLILEDISEETYLEYSISTVIFEVTVKFNGKILRESINFGIIIEPDLEGKKVKIFVEGKKKKLVSIRKTCQKANELKNKIKKAMWDWDVIGGELDKCYHMDGFLELLNKIREMAPEAPKAYFPFLITITFNKDIIKVFPTLNYERKEVEIYEIKVELDSKLKLTLFLDALINYYSYKDIVEKVEGSEVYLKLLNKNKKEQLEILGKIIELVKMYNLFS